MKLAKNILDIQFVKQHKVISVVLAYFIIGLIYVMTGELYSLFIGKERTFLPLIGILFSPFWPMMVYANFKHEGPMLQDVLALLSTIIVIAICVKNWIPTSKNQNRNTGIRERDETEPKLGG